MSDKTRLKTLSAIALGVVVGIGTAAVLTSIHAGAAGALAPLPIHMTGFPTAANTIDSLVSANNTAGIRTHGWALWAGITYVAPQQTWPVWETWYTDSDVAAGPPSKNAALLARTQPIHPFRRFRQFRHVREMKGLAEIIDPNEQVAGFNKFNEDYARFVWQNNYENPTVLGGLNQWPAGTTVPSRRIENFTYPAIGLKPVFMLVNGPTHSSGITVMPYWKGDLSTGPANSTDPANPTPGTWKQCVVVKTGTAAPPAGTKCKDGTTPPVIAVNLFYNFVLSAAEAAAMKAAQGLNAQAGDFAVLVAMHMTTRENSNWTWQTFWWNFSQPFPYGPPPATVKAPFNNYAMCNAYSMTVKNDPSQPNILCYNPYLETSPGIPDGVHSDCMSCHHVAGFGINANANYPASYSPSSYIDVDFNNDNTNYFNCQTTTDFSWFLAGLAKPPSTAPGCN